MRKERLTFNVTWVNGGGSSTFDFESLLELRVQGAVGIGKGDGPSLTQGGLKVVLCGGGWPPAPGILLYSVTGFSSRLSFDFPIDFHLSMELDKEARGSVYRLWACVMTRILSRTCTMRHWRTPGRRNEKVGIGFTWESHDPLSSRRFTLGKSSGLSSRFTGPVGPKRRDLATELGSLLDLRAIDPRQRRQEELPKSEVVENFWESGKDWDLDHTSGPRLHLPNRVIFSSTWRHRKTQARNRRRSSSSRMFSVTLSVETPLRLILRRIPRLFTMHPCADRHEGRIDHRGRSRDEHRSMNLFDLLTLWHFARRWYNNRIIKAICNYFL